MGLGILLAAMSGAGNSLASSVDQQQKFDHDSNMNKQRFDNDTLLNQQRADLEETKQKNLGDYIESRKNSDSDNAGEYIQDALNSKIPTPAAPVTSLTQDSADNADLKSGIQGDMENTINPLIEKLNGLIINPKSTAQQKQDSQDFLDQINKQIAGQKESNEDDVSGQSRAPTMREALAIAQENAAKEGDFRAMNLLKQSAEQKYMQGYGGFLNTDTGDIVGGNTSKAAVALKQEEGKNSRAQEANITKFEVAKEKATGSFKDPDTVSTDEKDLWLHQYIAGNGAVPRSAPAWVKNNIGTWAAEKGITPQDLSSGMAQTKYDQASANTAGHRAGAMAGVEAVIPALASNAVELASKLDQGRFVPINKLMQMGETSISDPDLSAFRVANQALISEYQQVISRGSTGNVTALNEAMKVLNGATDIYAYRSAVGQVMKEVEMNSAGMKQVRNEMGGGSAPKSLSINTDAQGGSLPPRMASPFVKPSAMPVLNYDPSTGTFH